jgi:uroporphyrinogen-III synthase
MRLVVTRPEPDASRTAGALVRLGHEPVLSPMLEIRFDLAAEIPRKLYQAVLVTSSNGVRAVARHPDRSRLADLPLLAVGDQTALEAKRAGFRLARSAGGAVGDLVALVRRDLDPRAGPLLRVAGDLPAGDLAGLLAGRGFEIDSAVVYRSVARSHLSAAAAEGLRRHEVGGILLYSPRSAAVFAAAVEAGGLAPLAETVACFCLSAAVAEALQRITRGPILCAARPDQISLFALVEDQERRPRPAGGR